MLRTGPRKPSTRWAGPGRRQPPSLTPARFLVLAYATVIAVGTAVLALPVAQRGTGGGDVVAAFFTAASAGTITGLTVVDTGTFWTPFGHVVILVLIVLGNVAAFGSTGRRR